MSQTVINIIEVAVILGFFWSASYQPQPAQCNDLKRIRKIGSLSGAFLLPLPLLVVVIINGNGLGGPLFWPLFFGFLRDAWIYRRYLLFCFTSCNPKTLTRVLQPSPWTAVGPLRGHLC
jgi:hypothetical protein